jgi:HPt (histidine-containing phosphotransfer) domain-containing protein
MVLPKKIPAKPTARWVAALLLLPPFMVPDSSAELSVLDPAVMTAIRSLGAPGEADIFVEVARLFLEDVPVHVSALSAAIAAGNAPTVARIAHSLRGNALEIGAVRMAPVCAAIENAARAGSLEGAVARAENLEREFAVTRETLQQVIG